MDVLDLDVLVEDAVGVDEDDRAHGARSQAAGLDDPVLWARPMSSSSLVKAALTSSAPEAMHPPPVQTSTWFLI